APLAVGILVSAVVCPTLPLGFAGGRRVVFNSRLLGIASNRIVPSSSLVTSPASARVEPSTRQKASVSSVSIRLHWGHRFISVVGGNVNAGTPLPSVWAIYDRLFLKNLGKST